MKHKTKRSVLSFVLCFCVLFSSIQFSSVNANAEEVEQEQAEETNEIVNNEVAEDIEKEVEQEQEVVDKVVEKVEEEGVVEKTRTPRSGGNRNTAFKIDSLVIKVNGAVADKDAPIDTSVTSSPSLSFDMSFSQAVPSQADFVAGDYFRYELCTVSGGTSMDLTGMSAVKKLYHGGVYLADGYLEMDKDPITGDITIYYRVVFNENIVGKNEISGTLNGNATISGLQTGETITIKRDGENIAEIEKKEPPSASGNPVGPPSGVEIPAVGKTVAGYDDSQGLVTWKIQLTDYVEKQFVDYENLPVSYQDLIFEEILDMHQTFDVTSYYNQGLRLTVNFPIYLYDKTGLSDGTQYANDILFIYLGSTSTSQNGTMQWIDPTDAGVHGGDPENYVKANAKTWTIVTETDPENSGFQRERLIVNFGAPYNGGLRYGDVCGADGVENILEKFDRELQNAKKVLEDNPGTNPAELLVDEHGLSRQRNLWEKAVEIYQDSYTYYNVREDEVLVGPYIYGMNMEIKTKVKTDQIETDTATKIKNAYKVSGGWEENSYEAEQNNAWSGTIMASAAIGDAQIFKADSLYGNQAGTKPDDSAVSGFIPNVKFEVYEETHNGPLLFDLVDGKYKYSATGALDGVTTNGTNGSLIITGLAYGNYYLKEVQAPDGFYSGQNQEIPFTVSGSHIEYKLLNNIARGVELIKIEEDDPDEKLAEAIFKLYTYTDDISNATEVQGFTLTEIDGTDYYVYDGNGGDELETLTGGALKIVRLPAGKYYLQETEAPTGYQVSNEKHTFELLEALPGDGKVIIDLGNIENAKLLTEVEEGFEASKSLTGRTLQNGEFDFVAELIKGDHTKITDLPANKKITAQNDGNGDITFADLKYTAEGSYIYEITEVDGGTIQDGVNYDGTIYYVAVTIGKDGNGNLIAEHVKYYETYDAVNGVSDEIAAANVVFENKVLTIDTIALDTKVVDPSTGAEVNGSRTPGEIQQGVPSINEVIVDTVAYTGLKPNTKYVIDSSLWHYTNPATPESGYLYKEFEDDGAGNDTGNGSVVKGAMEDGLGNTTLEFTTDGTGNGEIQVTYRFNGKNLGLHPLYGSYLVAHEVVYEYDDTKANNQGNEVIRHTDNQDPDQTIHYRHGTGSHLYSTSYTVTKVWEDNDNAAGDRPNSIKVQLYRDGVIFTDTETIKGEQTLDENNNWTYTWNDLPEYQDGTHVPSVYTVKEVDVPDSYSVVEDPDGTITNTHKAKDTEAQILKVDENDKPLAGAKLELYDAKGNLIAAWTSTESAYVLKDKLVPGETYTLKEKEAPAGYLLAKDVTFKAEKAGTVTKVKMVDVKKEEPKKEDPKKPGNETKNPKTGDTGSVALWIALIVACVLVIRRNKMMKAR